ncbi:uncharacterized protein Z519_11711 [Cladophialophora bantiana CBS 173.52]|uniref:Uncharacterized protein n=1 Tax=Cladophialophora bantiana (strain ATCC 10958 / CBS 173.52 / CDC B-1940 / NIH 8579) TaxID=1442370 RepID=A0A0D2FLY3_CLAB1|nr:uncharacterized protein Z519_11711 [Cladophialophora bantiana CBS 173.52]KIW87737.1 hypothetical protein Z519_11711 [Cladophialophora bantiana CBS 173.52]
MGDAAATPFPSPFKGWHNDTYQSIDPSRPELSLEGKTAIVTGGAGAIGSAIVNAFAKAGISLIGIVGRTQKTLDATKAKFESQYPNTKIVATAADTASLSSVEAAFKLIQQQAKKPIDIFVHNAGHLAEPSTIISSDPKEWWTSFEVNILGAFHSVRAFIPVGSPTATIINVSTAGIHVPTAIVADLSAYTASKLGALKVFEFVQSEHSDLHVVNIQPGVILSDINLKHGVMAPMDTPDLPASFTVWACSPEAKFLKNKFVWANWDVDEMKAKAGEIENSPAFTMGLLGWPVLS